MQVHCETQARSNHTLCLRDVLSVCHDSQHSDVYNKPTVSWIIVYKGFINFFSEDIESSTAVVFKESTLRVPSTYFIWTHKDGFIFKSLFGVLYFKLNIQQIFW